MHHFHRTDLAAERRLDGWSDGMSEHRMVEIGYNSTARS